MARPRRSNAKETSETRKDRTSPKDKRSGEAESKPESGPTAEVEETSTEDRSGRREEAGEVGCHATVTFIDPEPKESTTEAKAKIKTEEKAKVLGTLDEDGNRIKTPTYTMPPVRRPQCPVCSEHRNLEDKRGETVHCVNCRRTVTII